MIVATFGGFVVGGNLVVGLVIFLILIIIQFVVITKGAGRISEVAARFTLDAMPGKQMAIDAELNAGAIDETEARRRRQHLMREAEFYGAMDGASKFVRGDAIAALIITAINLIGGVIIGLMRHMPIVAGLADLLDPDRRRRLGLADPGLDHRHGLRHAGDQGDVAGQPGHWKSVPRSRPIASP